MALIVKNEKPTIIESYEVRMAKLQPQCRAASVEELLVWAGKVWLHDLCQAAVGELIRRGIRLPKEQGYGEKG